MKFIKTYSDFVKESATSEKLAKTSDEASINSDLD